MFFKQSYDPYYYISRRRAHCAVNVALALASFPVLGGREKTPTTYRASADGFRSLATLPTKNMSGNP